MKTKEELAKELNISRKTLYNYMNILNIKDLTEDNILILKNFSIQKNKLKLISKNDLLEELESLKIKNAELLKQNELLEKGQEVLLQQVEYFRNSLDTEILQIKQSITLLLKAPEEKKSLFSRLFKK